MPLARLQRRSNAGGDAAPDGRESGWGLARFLLMLALLAWAVRSLIVAPFSIPSGSMLPTLFIGDYLMVAKWPYGYSRYSFPFGFPSFDGRVLGGLPQRGDVVVFRHPNNETDFIKRVIGLPGDEVEIRSGEVILNNVRLPRRPLRPFRMPVSANSPCKAVPPALPAIRHQGGQSFCLYPRIVETLPGGPSYALLDQVPGGAADDRPAVRVPPGHLFLMGDNRDDSLDSRFPVIDQGTGMIPTERLIGRALVTFWSTDGTASYWKPWTWFTALRLRRIGGSYSGERE